MDFNPDFSESLKSQIINQSWFPLDWKKDPTISSMLTMLDAIAAKFEDLDNIWQSLKKRGNYILFSSHQRYGTDRRTLY